MDLTIPGGRVTIACDDWWGTASYSDSNYGDVVLEDGARHFWEFGAHGGGWWVYVCYQDIPTRYHDTGLEGVTWLAWGRWGANDPPQHIPWDIAAKLLTDSLTRFCAGEPPWKAPDNLHYTIDPEGQP